MSAIILPLYCIVWIILVYIPIKYKYPYWLPGNTLLLFMLHVPKIIISISTPHKYKYPFQLQILVITPENRFSKKIFFFEGGMHLVALMHSNHIICIEGGEIVNGARFCQGGQPPPLPPLK